MLIKFSECPVGSTQLGKRERLNETPSMKKSNVTLPLLKSVTTLICMLAGWKGITSLAVWYRWSTNVASSIVAREFSICAMVTVT